MKYLEIPFSLIQEHKTYFQTLIENEIQKFEGIEFIYDLRLHCISIRNLYNGEQAQKLENTNVKYDISTEFYDI